MAAEVHVSLLWGKLQKMLDEERFVFPGLRNRVATAVNELEKILCFLKASKSNHEIISISPQETSLQCTVSSSTPQEASLLRTIYSAEHFTESFLLQRRRKGVIQIEMPLAFSSWTQLWFSFKMMKLVQRVKAVSMQFGKTQGQPMVDNTELPERREIHAGQCCRRCHHLVGELVARLINENEASLRVISLVSKEVLGEEICFTTLAREVYDRQDIQQHFRSQAWLKVSRDPEYKNLLLALLKQLPSCVMNDLEHMNEKELCAMLFQFLMEDRFLIVLDGVQTIDAWFQLVRPFADAVNGSRVILTTHNIDVAKQADPWSSPLEPSPMIELEPDAIVDGHEAEVKELLSQLINHNDDSLRVISVVGNEAVGKTALVRNVYNRLDIRQRFPRRAWLHVSGDLAYKDLLLIILKQLPTRELKNLELMREEELSDMLFKFLMEHRFLIVLDDVQDQPVDVWHKLFRCFGDAVNGSRAILTTRDFHIAIQADPWSSPLELRPLTEEKSWSLFLKKVGRPEYSTELNNLRGDILRICDGFPVAIVLLGGVLSALDYKKWSRVIGLAGQRRGSQSRLANIVDFGYDQLPYVLKPCFLYLALFPKAYEIPIRRLLQLWLAEGFVQFIPDGTIPEDEAKRYLEELVCRNMIEIAKWKSDGSSKTCRMPTYLYDDFLPKANDIGFLHVHHCKKTDCTSTDSPESYIPRLADKYGVESSTSKSHTQQLRSYVSFNPQKRLKSNKEIGKFLTKIINRSDFSLLKVLDLEGVYKPSLPEKLGKLQNLRYIGLRWTGLDSCPLSIGDLPCLQTLDLKYTDIITLPSFIWKASLRHLYMSEVYIDKPPNGFQPNLQTLTGLLIDGRNPHKTYLFLFTSLRKLGLTCNSRSAKKTAMCINELSNLRTLRLRSREPTVTGMRPRTGKLVLAPMKEHRTLSNLYLFGQILDGIVNIPRNLRTLTLSMSELKEDPMPELGMLPQLNILRLFACCYAGSEMTCLAGNFPNLRVLKMWKLEELEQWKVEQGAMPNLVELEIRVCKKMKSLVGLEKLATLKELILTDMPQDFIKDVSRRLGRKILLTNKWEFPS